MSIMDKKILYAIVALIVLLIIVFSWEFLSSIGGYTYFDFSLSMTTSSGTVTQGQGIITYAKATLLSGTTQNVQFSISSCPSQITCSLTIKSGNPTFYSTLKVNTTTGTPAGTYKITVKGVGGGKTKYTTWTLIINPKSCTCDSWAKSGCGLGGCSNKMYQTRTCNPTGCNITSQCIDDSSCLCTCGSWINGTCGAGSCSTEERQQTRTCTPSGCNVTSQCVYDSSCKLRGVQWCYDNYATTKANWSLNNLSYYIPSTNYIYIDVWNKGSGNNVYAETDKSQYASAIQKARQKRYKIVMRVRYTYSDQYFMPPDVNIWFSNYTKAVKEWAQFAQSYNVELFSVGNEFTELEKDAYSSYWTNLLSQVRSVYSGKVYYNTNYWWNSALFNQKLSATWFKSLDYIGISSYWPMCDSSGANADQLVNNWYTYTGGWDLKTSIVDQMKNLSDKQGKRTIITTGSSSGKNSTTPSCMKPYAWRWAIVDLDAQKNWYDAVFRVFSNKTWVYGFVFDGAWETDPDRRLNPNNSDFTVQGKPTEQTIENCFNKISNGLFC